MRTLTAVRSLSNSRAVELPDAARIVNGLVDFDRIV